MVKRWKIDGERSLILFFTATQIPKLGYRECSANVWIHDFGDVKE